MLLPVVLVLPFLLWVGLILPPIALSLAALAQDSSFLWVTQQLAGVMLPPSPDFILQLGGITGGFLHLHHGFTYRLPSDATGSRSLSDYLLGGRAAGMGGCTAEFADELKLAGGWGVRRTCDRDRGWWLCLSRRLVMYCAVPRTQQVESGGVVFRTKACITRSFGRDIRCRIY